MDAMLCASPRQSVHPIPPPAPLSIVSSSEMFHDVELEGEDFMESNGRENLRDQNTIEVLLEREEQLASLIAAGLTDGEIAAQLITERHTVEERIAQLLAKIGAHDRLEIVFYLYSDPPLFYRSSPEGVLGLSAEPTKALRA